MSNFKPFAAAVHAQFTEMSRGELFTVNITGDELYAAYLAAFPEGSNPVFRERTEHDCSCCKNFIRNIGNVVSISDGIVVTVWDGSSDLPEPYNWVSEQLSVLVGGAAINGLFRVDQRSYGAESSKELRDGQVRTLNHFHGTIANKHFTVGPAEAIGSYNTTAGVFKRGLEELNVTAFADVLDLIASNSLYRGEEHLAALKAFQQAQTLYQLNGEQAKNTFIWSNAGQPAARFRNTAIGTLIQDLSEGMPLEQAVKAFEKKVAPENYKRPTALITPRMIQDAMGTINELGLEPALERRFAKLSDVSVNNVLWVDGSVAPKMKGGIEGLLMSAASKVFPQPTDKATDITIADFLANVLLGATSMDIVIKNAQQGNFVSLTAPVHAQVEPLFKWNNNFAWSYSSNTTDALKERVKAAGGTVEGDLCCRLGWEYTDDLDFHMMEPDGGEIYFGNRRSLSKCGGMLDVDANGMDGIRPDPAENIFYKDRAKMKNGVYTLQVSNYNRRSNGVGFEVQIEFDGQVHHIVSTDAVSTRTRVTVAKIGYSAGVFTLIDSLPATTGASKSSEKWSIPTEQMVKVSTVMLSPNYWDGNAIGNKHYIFALEGCKNDQPTRGIYNEFLSSKLEKHRKVFEILGAKTMCPPVNDQISGVGFSSTRGDTVLVNVTGPTIRKSYNITF